LYNIAQFLGEQVAKAVTKLKICQIIFKWTFQNQRKIERCIVDKQNEKGLDVQMDI
jgi:hypothetical protein